MKNVLIVCVSRDGVSLDFQRSMSNRVSRVTNGDQVYHDKEPPWLCIEGLTDLPYARNYALTAACTRAEYSGAEYVLLVDDDMSIALDQWEALQKSVVESGRAHSAVYVDKNGRPCLIKNPWIRNTWLTGLGMLLIPMAQLKTASLNCKVVTINGDRVLVFVTTGIQELPSGELMWVPEDYALCKALGGVLVDAKSYATHYKRIGLNPSPKVMVQIEAEQMRNIEDDPPETDRSP